MNEATLAAPSIVIFGWAILHEWFAARNLTGPLLNAGATAAEIVDVLVGVVPVVGLPRASATRHLAE